VSEQVIAVPPEQAARPDERTPPAERRTSSVELLWDLVFVFAVTQVTTLLSRHLSWAGFGRAMLVLALVWWAWSAFVWAANAQDEEARTLRLCLLVAGVFIFITGLSVPEAFGSSAVLFAVTYAVVRFLHLALYIDASRQGNAAWSAIAGFAITVAIGMGLLLAGSLASGAARIALWSAAVVIDYAGPAWLTRERLRSLQRVAVAHFAERYSLFVIICLGESIIALGVGATSSHRHLSAHLLTIVSLSLLTTIGMWWTYFDRFAGLAERRLRTHGDPVIAAADAYSYLHLVIVAGIITFAAGVRLLVSDAGAPSEPVRLALCGGLALYLVGNALFRARMMGIVSYAQLTVAAGLLIVFALGGGMSASALAAVITALFVVLCLSETLLPGHPVTS
jgi:low temperature requirement protein LtrA